MSKLINIRPDSTEDEIIKNLQLNFFGRDSLIIIEGVNNEYLKYEDLFKNIFNKYYKIFDFMAKNKHLLDWQYTIPYSMICYMNAEHFNILKKYKYDIINFMERLINENRMDIIKQILDVYKINEFYELKKAFVNYGLRNNYLCALYINNGYKLTDHDFGAIDKKFLEYIAEYSAEEWMNNRSCKSCYAEILASSINKLCHACKIKHQENEKFESLRAKLKRKNITE
jgi:hypothetical protein